MAPDGGLYTPVMIPEISSGDILRFCTMNYQERAAENLKSVSRRFCHGKSFSDFTKAAYSEDRFDDPSCSSRKET